MIRTRVKICGITRPEDGIMAAALGVDAIGLVFYPPSPRFVTIEAAQQIVAALPPFITVVGLFMNAEPAIVQSIMTHVPLHLLQFHGSEPPEMCAVFGLPYIKAVPMGATDTDIGEYTQRFASAQGLLLDSHGGDQPGGSGQSFDWERIPEHCNKPLILAGGLHPKNVAAAIRRVRPYAVDVSSGVEAAKGVKDAEKMRKFLQGVHEANERDT